MVLVDYSDKSCVLYGEDTQIYKDKIKDLGGKWNRNLSYDGNPIKGWIFPLKYKKSIEEFLEGLQKTSSQLVSKENDSKIPILVPKKTYCDVSVESTLRKEIQELNNKLNELSLGLKHQEAQLNIYISLFQMHKLDTVDDVIGELDRRTGKL